MCYVSSATIYHSKGDNIQEVLAIAVGAAVSDYLVGTRTTMKYFMETNPTRHSTQFLKYQVLGSTRHVPGT